MPKSYLIFKWVVYSLATLLLVLLQLFLLDRLAFRGLYPFLPPMLVGTVASMEGSRSGPVFALVFGLLCDLAIPGPAAGFFTLTFTLSALLSALLTEKLFSPGPTSSLVSVTLCYLITAAARAAVFLFRGHSGFSALLLIAAGEFLWSLPWLIPVYWLYRRVQRRTNIAY